MATAEKTTQQPGQKGSYKVLWILVTVCALPYLSALVYFQVKDYLPARETSNHGDLISPVRPVTGLRFEIIDGDSFDIDESQGKWLLVTVGASTCDRACEQNIYYIRQIRRAMARDRSRVERLFVLTDTRELQQFKDKLRDYEGMRVVTGPESSVNAITALLKNPNQTAANGIYMLDPLGNFFMSYPPGFDAELIIKDLRRVLAVSQIG